MYFLKVYCQTPDLGQRTRLGVDFTLAMEVCCSALPPSNKNPHLIFHTREGTRVMEFVTHT